MSSVDNRIVNMQFNNAQFEKNISQSLNSLDKLKQGLKLEESAKNLKDLESTANKFSLSSIGDAVQTISDRFSNMGIVGMTALQNLTNKAISVGKTLTDKITGPIVEGGKRRAQNIEQAKFKMEGLLGTERFEKEWNTINENINEGVRDTAYGYDAAASAASQFLASGISAGDELAGSLRAVSGAAAMTGGSYEEIAHIFTTVAGNGKIMGEQFQQFASRGLNVAATLAQQLNMTEEQVRDVKNNPIDFKTFADAMNKAYGDFATKANETYAGAVSNMKAALSRIGAEVATPQYENLRDVVNSITPVINNLKTALGPFIKIINDHFTEAAKTAIKFFDKFGVTVDKAGNKHLKPAAKLLVRTFAVLSRAFLNVRNFVQTVIAPIKEAFNEMFPKKTIRDVYDFANSIKDLTKKLSISTKNLDRIKRIFKGFFALFSIAKTLVSNVINIFFSFWKSSDVARGGILEFTAKIGDFIVRLDEAMKKGRFFSAVIDTLKAVFLSIIGVIQAVVTKIKLFFSAFSDGFKGFNGGIFEKFADLLSKAAAAIRDFAKAIADRLLGDDVKKSSELLNKLANVGIIAVLIKLKKELANGGGFVSKLTEPLENLTSKVEGIISSINKLFDGLSGALKSFQQKLKSEVLLNVAKGIALLTASLFVLSTIDSDSLYTSITIMGLMFTELAAFLKSFNKTFSGSKSALNVPAMLAAGKAITKISIGVFILAAAVKQLSTIPTKKLVRGISAVGALLTAVSLMIKALSGEKAKQLNKGITGVIAIAIAIKILANAVEQLSKLEWEELGKGTSAVSALLLALSAFIKTANGSKKIFSISVAMVVLGAAMEIFVNVAQKFAKMSWEELGKAGSAIGALVAALTIFVAVSSKLGKGTKMMFIATSLVILASSLNIIAGVSKRFSEMSWEELGKAGAAIGVLLISLAAFSVVISKMAKGGRLLIASVGLTILAESLEILSNVAQKFSIMSFGQITKSALGIDNLLTIIIVFNKKIKAGDLFKQSIGLFLFAGGVTQLVNCVTGLAEINVFALMKAIVAIAAILEIVRQFAKRVDDTSKMVIAVGAIILLAHAVKVLSSIGILGIVASVGALAAVFLVLGVGAKLLKPLIPIVTKLAKAMLLFSASMLIMGAGLVAIGAGLLMLGAGFNSIATAAGAIADVLIPFANGLKEAAPAVAQAVFAFLISILEEFDKFGPKLLDTIFKFLVNALQTIGDLIPEVGKFIGKFIKDIAPILKEKIPTLATLIFDFLSSVLDILIQRVPEIVVKVVTLFKTIFGALIDAIGDINPETFFSAITAFGSLVGIFTALAFVSRYIKSAVKTGIAIIVVFGLMTVMFLILNQIDSMSLLAMAGSLAAALIAVTACIGIASMIPAAAAVQGIAALAIAIGGITAILVAMGALQQIEGLDWLVQEGGKLLKSVGNAIGGFVGSIVGGFLEGVTEGLVGVADNLSDFMTHLQPFLDGIKTIDPESMNAVKTLADVILILTGAELIDGIANWITGGTDFKKFADGLAEMAPAIVDFSNEVKGNIDGDAITNSAKALLSLAKAMNEMPRSGGFVQWFTGESMSMDTFSENIKTFGSAIVSFSDTVAGKVKSKSVNAAANAGLALSKLYNSLPEFDGVGQWFGGTHMSMTKFSKEIQDFAKGIVDFSDTVAGKIKTKSVNAATNAGQALSDLYNSLPEFDGVGQWFGGTHMSMSKFATEIQDFAKGIVNYSNTLDKNGGIKEDLITTSVNAGNALSGLASGLPTEGGFLSIFSGETVSMTDFGRDLKGFGTAFMDYYNEIKDIKDPDILNTVTSSAVEILNILKAIDGGSLDTDDVTMFKDGVKAIAETDIEGFVAAFKSFYSDGENAETLATVGRNIILSIANGALGAAKDNLTGKSPDIASNIIDNLKSNINDEGRQKAFKGALSWYTEELTSFKDSTKGTFDTLGSTIVEAWIKGLNTKKADFQKTLSNYCKTDIENLNTVWPKEFGTIGNNMIAGLEGALTNDDNKKKVSKAMSDIGDELLKSIRNKLKIKSPSRATFGVGKYTILGLVKSFSFFKGMVTKSASDVADGILTSFSKPLSSVADYLGDDFYNSPVIRPVLDLSEIQNGSKNINGLFSDPSVGLRGLSINANSISGNIGLDDQNSVYNDSNVITAIEDLKTEVNTLSNSMKNLKIVMDNGAVVGALAPGIDSALGRTAAYKERGI